MPWKSDRQRRYMHAHPEKLGPAKMKEFDEASKGMKLTEAAPKPKKRRKKR